LSGVQEELMIGVVVESFWEVMEALRAEGNRILLIAAPLYRRVIASGSH
jgi:hypothetical protein